MKTLFLTLSLLLTSSIAQNAQASGLRPVPEGYKVEYEYYNLNVGPERIRVSDVAKVDQLARIDACIEKDVETATLVLPASATVWPISFSDLYERILAYSALAPNLQWKNKHLVLRVYRDTVAKTLSAEIYLEGYTVSPAASKRLLSPTEKIPHAALLQSLSPERGRAQHDSCFSQSTLSLLMSRALVELRTSVNEAVAKSKTIQRTQQRINHQNNILQ